MLRSWAGSVLAWGVVAGAAAGVAAGLLANAAALAAAQPPARLTVTGNFSCTGTNLTGTIDGTGLPAGTFLDSAVLQNGTVLAQDNSAKLASSDGSYHSNTLTFPDRGTVDVQITRATTGAVLVSASVTPPACLPPPEAAASADRACPTNIVNGVVQARYLHPNTHWALMYGSQTLAAAPGQNGAAVVTFPFSTTVVPRNATVMAMQLVDEDPGTRLPSVAVSAGLNLCAAVTTPPASRTTTAHASATASTTAATTTASTTAAGATPTDTGANAIAVASDSPTDTSAQAAGGGTHLATAAHNSGLGTWGALVAVAIALALGVFGLSAWYIYRAQRDRGQEL